MIKTDYFYGADAGHYSFYCLPQPLFTDEKLKKLSDSSKILYAMMLSRVYLSAKNNWKDEKGRVYIIFPLDEIQKAMGCAREKASKMLDELCSEEIGLIEKMRQGPRKTTIIYVKKIMSAQAEYEQLDIEHIKDRMISVVAVS